MAELLVLLAVAWVLLKLLSLPLAYWDSWLAARAYRAAVAAHLRGVSQ